ncbi:DNA polymerase-3 subunit gamma/tau [Methylohalomonas lacus]|uniref:DNA polymerase III subunit gamma/tau n=1 Tax=Methylohalomonas lacus TaxID=398773 RepID=A0AAE3HIA2_9GAMM|nr:DNA polymerase III subunit gamma/tau [Methylohalomonas lacus]MCS3902375.1 DNA polymerase-3 subunit gamma/tau [Methylohalomonas lacus]
MSYQVLARKWRPHRFEDVVGQEHVLRALANALDSDRLHHAYLFTGTRGTGKTTLARILAKCLNCEQGVSSTPCGECDTCRSVDEGRFVDLIEVDAASRAKVDETRDLMDNVQYAPSVGRFKVYLIDEVHMFSGHSFNALLKTLEEPPPHVKFLLATTEPKRIPITILSRCIQFNLKHLAPAQIESQLTKILDAETLSYEPAACRLIAQSAEGSLRDGLSLLDQAIAYGNGSLAEAPVREMLGTLDAGALLEILEQLAQADAAGLMRCAARLAEHQHDYAAALAEISNCLYRIAVIQVAGSDPESGVDSERLQALAQEMSPEDVQLYYQIALQGRRDLAMTPDPQVGFEMTLVRMLAFRPAVAVASDGTAGGGQTRAVSQATTSAAAPAAAVGAQASAALAKPAGADNTASAPTDDAVAEPRPATVAGTLQPDDWGQAIDAMQLSGLVRQLASHCVLKQHSGQKLELIMPPEHEPLLASVQQERLQQALRDYLDPDLKLVITVEKTERESPADVRLREADERQREAVRAVEQDPLVQSMMETFNAEIDPQSIQPE